MDDCNLSPGALNDKTKDELIALVRAMGAGRFTLPDALRETPLFEAIFRDLPDAILVVNPDRKIRMVNNAFARLFGYEDGELHGSSTATLYADRAEYERQGRLRYHLNAGGALEPHVQRLRRKDGTIFLGESVGTVLCNSENKVICFLGLVRDVTDREATLRALRDGERRFRDFSQAGAYRFWETDAEGRYTFMSPSNAAFPNPEERMIGQQQWKSDVFEADERALRAVMDKVARRQPFNDFHYAMSDGNGGRTYRRSSGVPVFDSEGNFTGYRGVSIDETAEMLARREAETLSARFYAAIENFHAGFCLWTGDRRFVACNEFYRKSSGRAAAALRPGAHFEEFIRLRADEISEYRGVDRDQWMRDRLADFDLPMASHEYRDPDETWYRLTKQRLRNGDCLFFLADITPDKLREEELIEAKLVAESASRRKSEFLSNVSHELRTPLNAILGFAQIFERASSGMSPEKFGRFGSIIRDNGTYLLDLINGILDLSAIEAGRLNLNEEKASLAVIVDEAVQLVRVRAAEDGIELVNSITPDAPHVYVDRVKLKQVLVNLLTNGIKFTPGGGRVEIRYLLNGDGDLDIQIVDTGIGMSREEIAVALEKFGRIGRSRKAARDGIGLGLPLAKELMEAHGGNLSVTSTPNAGTTVTVCLPDYRVLP